MSIVTRTPRLVEVNDVVRRVVAWKTQNPPRPTSSQNRETVKRRLKILSAGLNGGNHSEAEWHDLLLSYGNKCANCGSTEDLTRDHIIPLNEGGGDHIENLQPLCRTCNSKKGTARTAYPVKERPV